MKQFILACCLVAGATSSTWVAAQTPGLIDRPTPPPCAADGTCYPNTKVWGYYQVRWRTWPGTSYASDATKLEPTPADLGPELRPHETPPAELEDKQAPPATTKRTPPTPPEAPAAEEEADGEPGLPPGPMGTPPNSPTSDTDPPPAFPLSMSTRTRATDTRVGTTSRLVKPRTTANDPPPAPPWGHRASL